MKTELYRMWNKLWIHLSHKYLVMFSTAIALVVVECCLPDLTLLWCIDVNKFYSWARQLLSIFTTRKQRLPFWYLIIITRLINDNNCKSKIITWYETPSTWTFESGSVRNQCAKIFQSVCYLPIDRLVREGWSSWGHSHVVGWVRERSFLSAGLIDDPLRGRMSNEGLGELVTVHDWVISEEPKRYLGQFKNSWSA